MRNPAIRSSEAAMQYRVQFLDSLDNVLREIQAEGRSAGTAFVRGASTVWPPHAIWVRVLDRNGRASVSNPRRAAA